MALTEKARALTQILVGKLHLMKAKQKDTLTLNEEERGELYLMATNRINLHDTIGSLADARDSRDKRIVELMEENKLLNKQLDGCQDTLSS